jgi:hypothetical protein
MKAKAIMVTDNWQFTFQNNIRELSIDAEAVGNEEEMKMLIRMQKRICG